MTLSEWMFDCCKKGHTCVAVKRPPRKGECYEDGTPILNPVNAGWQDIVTGEVYWMPSAMR